MTRLNDVDFPEFFAQCNNGRAPFPWQRDLVAEVLRRGRWPDAIDIPTGLGKTSILDAAVFVSAAAAGRADGPARRRVFFVVDRRIVVDEAWSHAQHLASVLASAGNAQQDNSVAAVVARQFIGPDVGDAPATVTRMRGGINWSSNWMDRPDRFGIVLGTVDQVGSRFFFRGYGVSERRAPIDAALVGNDSLIVVDEAHLAEPLLRSIRDARALDSHSLPVPATHVVTMSATGRDDPNGWTFRLDVDAHLSVADTTRRLRASKALSLHAVHKGRLAEQLASDAAQMVGEAHRAVLVTCNTVGKARAVHSLLAKSVRGVPVLLLTGRSRSVDRQRLVDDVLDRIGVDRDRERDKTSVILVATQTVEVGANIDADALVTECAPIDALVQRLGRTNRLGLLDSAPVVVAAEDDRDDPVYGTASAEAWRFLTALLGGNQSLPASPLAVRAWRPPAAALSNRPTTPMMLGPVLDSWVRTGPVPVPDTPVAPYLRGLGTEPPSVTVAWRDDIDDADGDRLAGRLHALPPAAAEQVDVPYIGFRQWLADWSRGRAVDFADVDMLMTAPSEEAQPTGRVAVIRDGTWQWLPAASVKPGDSVVVPTERGGLDEYGWTPAAQDPATDVAERAYLARRSVLRLDDRTARRLDLGGTPHAEAIQAAVRAILNAVRQGERPDLAALLNILHAITMDLPPDDWRMRLLTTLRSASAVRIIDDGQLLLRATSASERDNVEAQQDDAREAGSSIGAVPVSLARHGTAVEQRARSWAVSLGLPDPLTEAVSKAARWHDLGKAEPRFQAMLHGGDQFLAELASEPLAKSGMDADDRVAYQRARERSGLPPGARHEAWSERIVHLLRQGSPMSQVLCDGLDYELVEHLIASHHGHNRPLLPPVPDPEPITFPVIVDGAAIKVDTAPSVNWDAPARFTRLNARYGRWGLALLETIVRLADISCSQEGT